MSEFQFQKASVIISGVGNPDYNGVFPMVETLATDFVFWSNIAGTSYFSYDPNTGSESNFVLGSGVNALDVEAIAFTGPSTVNVSIGAAVEAAHFDGLTVSDGGIQVGDAVYTFSGGAVSVIPEPSILLLLGFSLGLVTVLRRYGKVSR